MAELKTKKTEASVAVFLAGVADEVKRKDSQTLVRMMKKATRADPKMWGPAIVGFGNRRLVYDSGRELDWFPVGFSPRKGALTIYLSGGLELYAQLRKKLGKHEVGKGCLYIKRLSDVDLTVLEEMIHRCVEAAARA